MTASSRWDSYAELVITEIGRVNGEKLRPDVAAWLKIKIVGCMSAAYRIGFHKADSNPRHPESMGR